MSCQAYELGFNVAMGFILGYFGMSLIVAIVERTRKSKDAP